MIRKLLIGHFYHTGIMGIIILLMLCHEAGLGQNLVVNGNFEARNLVGFSSNYGFIPISTGTTNAGQYGIGQNPLPFNTASFFSTGDHTSGSGNMMIVDGTNNGGNTDPFFWRINNNGEICGLTVGETYTFSYWVKSVYKNEIIGATSADIGIKWNNVQGQSPLGLIVPASGNMLVLPPPGDWQQVTYHFVPTNSCVRIEMFDRNSNPAGNDFAIDDIELFPPTPPLQIGFAIIPPACPDANDGFIAAYGRGGKTPYSYRFNSGSFSSDIVLANLGVVSGQIITLRDANSPPTEVSVTDISIPVPENPLDAGPNGTVCGGQVYRLSATGGSSYTWTATPEDTSLTTPNIANPLVRPLVKTKYTVSGQVSMVRNLIYNGDFSEGSSGGNIGFGSDYIQRSSNPNGLQGVYGIVSNGKAFSTDFADCSGVGGTGDPMFVVDGSSKNDAKVWWQQVPVQPNTIYTFTYFLQSVQAGSPALIETRINNQPITGNPGTSTQTAPNGTCTWQQVTYNWNSGATTLAQICLYNRNLASAGNDFALDNISFSTNVVCTVSRQVTVNVNREEAPVVDNLVQPTCRYPTGGFQVISPVTSGNEFEYSANGTTFQDNPQFTNLLPGTYTACYRRKSTGCISHALSVVINPIPPNPPRPVISAIKHPTCNDPGGAFDILSPVGPNFEYSGDSLINYGSDNTLGALPSGNWLLYARDITTGCYSEPLPYTINPQPQPLPIPTATVSVQPTCTNPTATILVTAPKGPGLKYSLDGINYQFPATFSGLLPGTYQVTVKGNETTCISSPLTIVVNPSASTPPVPTASVTVQPNCVVVRGTIVFAAPLGASFEYSINNGVNYKADPVFSNLSSGTYEARIKNTATGCISNSKILTVNPLPGAPPGATSSITIQPTCTNPTGTLVVSAPVGAEFEYSLDGINFQSSTVFSKVQPGTYNVRTRNIFTFCISNSLGVTVSPAPSAPPKPTATVTRQPDCAIPSGAIVISSPVAGSLVYSSDGVNFQPNPAFSGLPPGTYNLSVRDNNSGCLSSNLSLTINAVPQPPPVPTALVTVQPSCIISTGTLEISDPTGAGIEYSINGTSWQKGTQFTGLLPGTYQVRARNTATGCISAPNPMVINSLPIPPAIPTATVMAQPTCALQMGSIIITSPTGTGLEYSVNGLAWQNGTSFTGLAPGNYGVRVKDPATGCTSAILPLVVNAVPAPPAAPTASVTVQPTCTVPAATIVISAPAGIDLEYSIDGINWQTNNRFEGLAPGNYNIRVRNSTTLCISNSTSLLVNDIPLPPAAPAAIVSVQPGCGSPVGTIEITAPAGAGLEFSLDGNTWQGSAIFPGLAPNTYTPRVRNSSSGCMSTGAALIVKEPPPVPASPTVAVTVEPTCLLPAGTVVISAPTGAGLEYSLNSNTWQTGTSFSGLLPNTYQARVRNAASGCTSNATTVVVNAPPAPPPTPVASVTHQPDCTDPAGIIVITSPTGALLDYSIDGINFQAGLTFNRVSPGNYGVRARENIKGCISNILPLVVQAVPQPSPPPVVQSPLSFCQFQTGLAPLTATGTNLKWYATQTGGTGSSTAPVPSTALAGSSTWYVSQTLAAGCESEKAAITVQVVPVPTISMQTKKLEIRFGQSVLLPATITGQGVNIRWSPSAGLNDPTLEKPLAGPQNTTTYTVLASISQTCSASDTIRVVVLKEVVVPNVFTPNGDGINDKWVIKYLEDYPNASLEVYDRYGKNILGKKAGLTPWDGTAGGQQVPTGTYYYILRLDSTKVLNGSVTILR